VEIIDGISGSLRFLLVRLAVEENDAWESEADTDSLDVKEIEKMLTIILELLGVHNVLR